MLTVTVPQFHLECHGDDEDVPEDHLHAGDPGGAPRPAAELDPDVACPARIDIQTSHSGEATSLEVSLEEVSKWLTLTPLRHQRSVTLTNCHCKQR